MTELQRRFSTSKVLRNALYQYFESEGITVKGAKRTLNEIIRDVFCQMSEYEIRYTLLQFIEACDITPAERIECAELLLIGK